MLKCTSVNSSTSFVFEIWQICLSLLLPCWCPAFYLISEHNYTFIFWTGPSCCVSRCFRGGRNWWWSTPKTSCPFTPSTWTPLWRSSPPRAGTASRFSSCSMTSSVWTVSSCIHTSFTTLSFSFEHEKKPTKIFLLLFCTDHLCNGKFHKHLQDLYAPLVVRYVDLMESSITQSIHKGFERESWEPVK